MSEYIKMSPPGPHDAPLVMTCPRLRWQEAIWVLAISLLVWWAAPRWNVWTAAPSFAQDYRTPYESSEDYWRFRQLTSATARDAQILMLGDSVIWGEYVPAADTLPAALNRAQNVVTFRNGGVNGMHPLALHGLVEYYGQPLHNQAVLLHCNLLWLTSPERDLTVDSGLSFNHPRLVAQFWPWIPGYRATVSDRLSVVAERHLLLRQWVRHLWIRYLDGQDLPRWTLEHPSSWPRATVDADTSGTRQNSAPWSERGIPPQDYPWVPLDHSLQWQAFQQTVDALQHRGNRLFVLVGPFNAHLLTEANRSEWQRRRASIVQWLQQHGVRHLAPPPLPSQHYADASHPLGAGYQQLAEQLLADPSFRDWMTERSAAPR